MRHFIGNDKGGVAVLFAGVLVLLLGAAGLGIDTARIYKAQLELQSAVDGAALAAGADFSSDLSGLKAVVGNYLTGNTSALGAMGEIASDVTYESDDAIVAVSAQGKVETVFMRLLGLRTADLAASARVTRARKRPLELVLALDHSDSMTGEIDGFPKSETMTTAASRLASVAMSSPMTKVGLVLFNVGVRFQAGDESGYFGARWIDHPPDKRVENCWIKCVYPSNARHVEVRQSCISDGVEKECVSRIIEPPCEPQPKKCGDPPWKMERVWRGGVGFRYSHRTSIADPLDHPYPSNEEAEGFLQDLTAEKDVIQEAILTSMFRGPTYLPGALIWAWNLLDPSEPFTTAEPYADIEARSGTKAVVLMTDGANTMYLAPDNTVQDAFELKEGEREQRIAETNSDTRELCANMKSEGIVIYTVAFGITDHNALEILADCASDSGKSFAEGDNEGLYRAFGKIAASLQSVRLVE